MRRLLSVLFLAMAATTIGQSPEIRTVLSYRFVHGTYIHDVRVSNEKGDCNVTVTTSTGNGAAKYTRPYKPATLTEIVKALPPKEAFSGYLIDQDRVKAEAHHSLEVTHEDERGIKSLSYVIADKNAPKAFIAWKERLLDTLPKTKREMWPDSFPQR